MVLSWRGENVAHDVRKSACFAASRADWRDELQVRREERMVCDVLSLRAVMGSCGRHVSMSNMRSSKWNETRDVRDVRDASSVGHGKQSMRTKAVTLLAVHATSKLW